MSGDYFTVSRKLFRNPIWYSEKFTRGQAWIDLLGNANHSHGYFEKKCQRVDIRRGQTGRSIDTLASDWKWSRNKVKRFLKRLEDDRMIDRETNHLTSIITICNYNEYQLNKNIDGPSNEPSGEPSNEPSGEPQTKRNKKKQKEIIKGESIFSDFDLFIKELPDYIFKKGHTKKQIIETSENLLSYCLANGRKYKDYYSALRNFLSKVEVTKKRVEQW